MNKKRLFRNKQNKIIGGVCGGLADYFNIDPVIIRILFVVTTIGWGVGLLLYLLLWIAVPEKDLSPEEILFEEPVKEDNNLKAVNRKKYSNLFGVILIFVGAMFLLDNIFWDMNRESIFAILIIGIGVFVILSSYGKLNLNGDNA